jgi:hypothetical protein
MTVNVNFISVADAISKLTITGVTVRDIDQIAASVQMAPATLAPKPGGFITNMKVATDSFGTGGGQKMTLDYTLNYTYYHCQIGSVLDFASYSAMVTKIAVILVALMSNDVVTGAFDQNPKISDIGPVLDPAGNQYHGCVFSLDITQFVEVA